MSAIIQPTTAASCSAFPEKQMPQAYVVRLAGTCCKCAESGKGSHCRCCDGSGKCNCGGFNGDFVVRQTADDPCCYEHVFVKEEFSGGKIPCKAEKLRLSIAKQDDGRVSACVILFFEDSGPVTWHKPRICQPCQIGTLRRIRTNTKCCFPQTVTVNGTPVPDFVAPQPEWYAGNPDDLNDASYWPSLDLDLYEDSPHVPVRYFNGELNLRIKVLHSDGQSIPWGHTLIYSNRLSNSYDFGNGYNWLVHELPQLVLQKNDPVFIEKLIKKDPTRDGKATGCTLVLLRGTRNALWFDEFLPKNCKQPVWIARFGAKHVLQHDRDRMMFRLVAPNGHVWEFDDFTSVCSERVRALPPEQRANRAPGMFKRHLGPGGEKVQQVDATYKDCQIQKVERVTKQDEKQITERFRYEYYEKSEDVSAADVASGAAAVDDENAGRLWRVTLERGVKSAAGKLPALRRATFTYYGENDKNGNVGDLKTIFSEFHSGKTGRERNAWKHRKDALHYFRYHKHSIGTYCQGLLKLYVAPEGFYRAKQKLDQSIFAVEDKQLRPFAELDVCYWGYPSSALIREPHRYAEPRLQQRAVRDIAIDGGMRKHRFHYSLDPWIGSLPVSAETNERTSPPPLPSYARVITSTHETRADGNEWHVLANFVGQTRFRLLRGHGTPLDPKSAQGLTNSGPLWQEERRDYDEGHAGLIRHFTPSGVAGRFLQTVSDPNSPKARGIIYYLGYHTPRKSIGYLAKVSRGPTGGNRDKAILLNTYDYRKPPKKSLGQEMHLVERETTWYVATTDKKKFPTNQPGSADPSRDRVIRFKYEFHPGSCQISERTTLLPAVPLSQNGSGRENSVWESYDRYGNVSVSRNLRNVLSVFLYDNSLGVLIKGVIDADTSIIPWVGQPGKNLVTDFIPDRFGRTVKTIGPKFHALANARSAFQLAPTGETPVRAAVITAFDEAHGEILSVPAYVACSSSDTHILSPATVVTLDRAGRVTSENAYDLGGFVRQSELDKPATFRNVLSIRRTEYEYANDNTLTWTREYHDVAGEKYRETSFSYDPMRRAYRVVDPTGTIRKSSFDARGLPLMVKVGTTEKNLKIVSEFKYDYPPGAGPRMFRALGFVGNGIVTRRYDHVDDNIVRVASLEHDWLDRVTKTDRDVLLNRKPVPDRLRPQFGRGNATKIEYAGSQFDVAAKSVYLDTENDPSTGTLMDVDVLGRIYRKVTRPVEDETPGLLEEFWRDDAGDVVRYKPAGADAAVRYQYDRLGQVEKQYLGVSRLNPAWNSRPEYVRTVKFDIVLEQREFERDRVGNVIGVKLYQRHALEPSHDNISLESLLGDLTRAGKQVPGSRITYTAFWHDALGRQRAVADYGTNIPPRRPPVVPAHDSKGVLVTTVDFNSRGERERLRDADYQLGRGETFFQFDDLGRATEQIENSNSLQTNRRTTRFTYRPDDQIETVTLAMRSGQDQTTRYLYGTTLADSDIAAGNLRTAIVTPDGARSPLAYNRQGEVKRMTDPNGNIHRYEFDGLGRLRADRIVQFGRLTDRTVREIQWHYNREGRLEAVNSLGASGRVLNGVWYEYARLGMLRAESQEHFGRSGPSLGESVPNSSPNVEYQYGKSDEDEPRLDKMFYPGIILNDGDTKLPQFPRRCLHYKYDGARGVNADLGRVHTIEYSHHHSKSAGWDAAQYVYAGVADLSWLRFPEAALATNLGDYNALNQFGAISNVQWKQGDEQRETLQHFYDAAGNRLARLNLLSKDPGRHELYHYDGLSRLESFEQGNKVRVEAVEPWKATIPPDERTDQQSWQLDKAGNWKEFKWQEDEGLKKPQSRQTRNHNAANEITSITVTSAPTRPRYWAQPRYDAAGNMIRMPNPHQRDEVLRCKYDAWNGMVEVQDQRGKTIAKYQYDGLGRRIIKQTKDSQGKDVWRHYYYLRNGQVIEEAQAAPQKRAWYPDRQHFWGADGQLLFSEHGAVDTKARVSVLDKRLYAIRDALGSVTGLLKYDPESEESTLDGRFSYQPYGEPRVLNNDFSHSGESLWHDFDYLFAGYRYDHETGLYHTRARQYHPLLGVWTGRDPAGYVDGLNLYQYVVGSPTNFVDPSGEAISLLAVGGVALVGLLLMPQLIDPRSEVGVSDETAEAIHAAHEEQTAREAALFASFMIPMGGATSFVSRTTLGAGMNVAFHGLEDALTYSVTGQLDYVDAQGNFSPSAMATSYLWSAGIGAALPGAATVVGRGTRWTGRRLSRTRELVISHAPSDLPLDHKISLHVLRRSDKDVIGHVLVSLESPGGNRIAAGFSPEELPNLRNIRDLFRIVTGTPGKVYNELDDLATYYRFLPDSQFRTATFSISARQAKAVQQFVARSARIAEIRGSLRYRLFCSNCATFANQALLKAGVSPPTRIPIPRLMFRRLGNQ